MEIFNAVPSGAVFGALSSFRRISSFLGGVDQSLIRWVYSIDKSREFIGP